MKRGTAERDTRTVRDTLMKCLAEIAQDGALSRDISESENLLESGILDSVGVVQLVTFIEGRFGIRMSEADFASPEFTHVGGLVKIIRRRQGSDAEGQPGASAGSGGGE